MSELKVSIRYATSLLESAKEKNTTDSVFHDMELINSSLYASRDLQLMLENPVIKPNAKLTVLEEIYKNKISSESLSFLKFLVEKGRVNLLSSIVKKFLELHDEYLGIVNVKISSAVKLNEDQESLLKNKFEKILQKKVRLSFKIDDSVLGGFVAEVSDTVYDASLKHQLDILKKQFLTNSVSLN